MVSQAELSVVVPTAIFISFHGFLQVKLALYSSRGRPLLDSPLIFKVTKASQLTYFFRRENLVESPWKDLKENKNPVAFGTLSSLCSQVSAHCRLFEAMKTFGDDQSAQAEERCDGDSGWLMLTGPNNTICPFEKKRGRQMVFLYSKGKGAVKFNDDSESSKCLSDTFSFFFIPLDKNSTSEGLLPEKMKLSNRKLKQATVSYTHLTLPTKLEV